MTSPFIIRENLTPQQVLDIREKELARGNQVNIRRIHSTLVEIEIFPASEVNPYEMGDAIVVGHISASGSSSPRLSQQRQKLLPSLHG